MNKKINELKNIHEGEDIWVIGAGSSMDYVDSSFFENKISISVNQMYEHFPCEYVVGRDLMVRERWENTIKDLSNRKDIKFLYSRLHQGYGPVNSIIESDNFYSFESGIRDDVKGLVYGSELSLSPSVNFEIAYDDKDKAGLEDEYYVKLMFVHPPRNTASLADGISSEMWRSKTDMSDQMLTKVQRNNKIMVEFNGSASIVRGD